MDMNGVQRVAMEWVKLVWVLVSFPGALEPSKLAGGVFL